jgi:hypothetical protein
VFSFDVLKAIGRKGGDLVQAKVGDDDYNRKRNEKKKRGRKNKYYR